jgi:elongation factor G
MSSNPADIRNITFAGHGSTGKTTLLEVLLSTGGVIPRAETVDSGKTVSDFTDEEIERKISIHAALAGMEWKGKQLNFIDTPGSSDFLGEIIAGFRAAETAVVLIDAQAGVQIETIKIWRRLNARSMPRIAFINKCDRERADFEKAIEDLRENFEMTFIPVTIPMGVGPEFKGVIDLLENKAYPAHAREDKETASAIPDEFADTVEEYRMALIEAAAEGDDELLEKYFEEGDLSEEEIIRGLQEGLRGNKFVPVLCGVAENACGTIPLLDFLAEIAPSPDGVTEHIVKDGNEEEITISADGEPACFVFKTSIDQFSGRLSYIKVMSGSLTADSELYTLREQQKERVSKLYRAVGKKLIDAKELAAGDIGILAKLDSAKTNDTLASTQEAVAYAPLALPQPVHSLAINATSKKEEDKLNQFIQRIADQDLTFQIRYNTETKENVIAGMGELHINMILDMLREKQKIEAETKVPKVAYRETITKPSGGEYTHKKQTGGHGQYGRVVLEIRPLPRGEQFEFTNAIKGMAVSKGYMPGIEKGLLEAMEAGYLAGYPIVDLSATIVDGKEHSVDSSEMAFKLAARGALQAAMDKAGPVLLEPVYKLTVMTNEQYVGDILSDLSSRRGRVLGQEPVGGGIVEIIAEVPQSELLRYSIDLRSITSGTASFEMEFDHYSPISGKIADDVIAASKREEEE